MNLSDQPSSVAPDPSRIDKEYLIAGILIVIIAVAVYLPIVNQDFTNWDDPKHIKAVWKPAFDRAWCIITDFDLKYTNVAYYSPLHFLSLMIDQTLVVNSSQPQAWISKLMNVLYHAVNSLLVFLLLITLGAKRKAALFGALVFAVHPIQVGTVAWIAERKNLLCTMFYLGGLLGFIKYLSSEKNRYLVAVIVCFLAGLLSKPAAVTLPVVMAAWMVTTNQRSWKGYYLLALLVACAVGWGIYVISTEVSYPGVVPNLEHRPLLAAASIWFYLSKFFYPVDLVLVYPRWNVADHVLEFSALLVALVLIAGAVVYYRRRFESTILFGLFFFLINLLPVSGLVAFGHMGHSFVADHFMYLPMVGLAIVVSQSARELFNRLANRRWLNEGLTAVLYALVCVLALLSFKQGFLWRDPAALWEATLKITKTSAAAYCNYGSELMKRGDYTRALEYFGRAADLAPSLDVAYVNMARSYYALGDRENARLMFRRTVEVSPKHPGARTMLAAMLREEGRYQEALEFSRESVNASPADPVLWNDLGISLFRAGETDQALAAFDKATELDGFFANPYIHRAAILLEGKEDTDTAISFLTKALTLTSSPEAHRLLGIAYARKGDSRTSLEEFMKAYTVQPDLPGLRENMAQLLLDLGQIEAVEELCDEAEKSGKPCSKDVIERLKAARSEKK
ncbi:tetratricopeptide repeat protein [Desulfomonile tiedjei]|uniref:Tfp pilus assembly protein PilF n=1 Tax=Desulfomonile tiedjei (strain ATCC 49306 / DSM 6799 / DCB-1) TaxID=706587 RepID=I4C310_DESTA|nr:tetratricopeptide repeat protein [Desulfomonile tiedjei]AFM23951.1 Tfp pilus assembly protein PilF [Desulfomonile tiedjei DSM 6799]